MTYTIKLDYDKLLGIVVSEQNNIKLDWENHEVEVEGILTGYSSVSLYKDGIMIIRLRVDGDTKEVREEKLFKSIILIGLNHIPKISTEVLDEPEESKINNAKDVLLNNGYTLFKNGKGEAKIKFTRTDMTDRLKVTGELILTGTIYNDDKVEWKITSEGRNAPLFMKLVEFTTKSYAARMPVNAADLKPIYMKYEDYVNSLNNGK